MVSRDTIASIMSGLNYIPESTVYDMVTEDEFVDDYFSDNRLRQVMMAQMHDNFNTFTFTSLYARILSKVFHELFYLTHKIDIHVHIQVCNNSF